MTYQYGLWSANDIDRRMSRYIKYNNDEKHLEYLKKLKQTLLNINDTYVLLTSNIDD